MKWQYFLERDIMEFMKSGMDPSAMTSLRFIPCACTPVSVFNTRIRKMGKVIISVCLSVHTPGVSTLPVGYLPWPGGIPTLTGGGGYLPWTGGTYLGWGGVPTLARGEGYPPWQHRKYLLHGGRYASCVHAGGLSCSYMWIDLRQSQTSPFTFIKFKECQEELYLNFVIFKVQIFKIH